MWSKYYVAGGSVCYMFDFGVTKFVGLLKQAIDVVSGAVSGSVGDAIDHLLSRLDHRWGATKFYFVSQYAVSVLAMFGDSSWIKRFADIVMPDSGSAESILEVFLFAKLRKGGVTLYAKDGSELQWAQAEVKVASPSALSSKLDTAGIWIKPPVFNQGGYDAMYIDKAQGLVDFVQVTRARTVSASATSTSF